MRGITVMAVLAALLMPMALGVDVGTNMNISMQTEQFKPLIWMCDHRLILDDNVEPGRLSGPGEPLIERIENYAFEGEQISWDVLVMDKNGIDKIKDVHVTVGKQQGEGNPMEANCQKMTDWQPDGKTIIQLCKTVEEKTGPCVLVGGLPIGTVEYTKYGKQLLLKIDLYGLNSSRRYQLALEGTFGEDGNTELATQTCPSPNVPDINGEWVCGWWPYPQVPTSVGFYNFDMNATPNPSGEFHKSYSLSLAAGHYAKVKFLVKDTVTPTWFNTMHNLELMDFYIEDKDSTSPKCNARIGEEEIKEFDPETMGWYRCTLTVETAASMSGEYWITPEVEDLTGLFGTTDEKEFWFFNPQIALAIDGAIDFGTVRPGVSSYSPTITLGNDAEAGSGVLMEMFIAGTDFYDPSSSGAKCPTTNQLALTNFAYFATNGAYSTQGKSCSDTEGYSSIPYGDRITQGKEVIGCDKYGTGGMYTPGNVLTPQSEMSLTFRLKLPEPCNGDFSSGSIYFWGEAI